jgi:hypothetical protein
LKLNKSQVYEKLDKYRHFTEEVIIILYLVVNKAITELITGGASPLALFRSH